MNVDTVQLFAKFNAHANSEMNQVLSLLPQKDWTRDLGGYYSSFRSLLGHLYTVDITWLVRFIGHRQFKSLTGEVFEFPPAPGEVPFETMQQYFEKRKSLDASLVAFAHELTDDDLAASLLYKNFRGEDQSKNLGGLVLHLFNHQTHHRGMVALYLDQLDIPNDFNSLSAVV